MNIHLSKRSLGARFCWSWAGWSCGKGWNCYYHTHCSAGNGEVQFSSVLAVVGPLSVHLCYNRYAK